MQKIKTLLSRRVYVLLSLISIAVYSLSPLYSHATDDYLDSTLKTAAKTYISSRAINGAISIIQHTDLGFSAGVDIQLAPGEILQPIHDTIERFSDIITFSLLSLGAEKIFFEISSTPIMWFIVTLLAVLYMFRPTDINKKLLITLIIFKLFVPFSSMLSAMTTDDVFAPKIALNLQILQNAYPHHAHLASIHWWNKVSNKLSNAKNDIQYYASHNNEINDALLNLATIYASQFLLNIIVLPLLLIYIIKNIIPDLPVNIKKKRLN